jgi:alkylated DNA repair dioxygenase AlkB
VGCNLYRNGDDSVAWHADRVHRPGDSIVAIVSVGERRPFSIRPIDGGPSRTWPLGDGDLFVLGGTIQARWQHTVPKVAAAGERISVMVRG